MIELTEDIKLMTFLAVMVMIQSKDTMEMTESAVEKVTIKLKEA
jgi:hypothetical protein